jgi:murein L,D-transpeptidase YafK
VPRAGRWIVPRIVFATVVHIAGVAAANPPLRGLTSWRADYTLAGTIRARKARENKLTEVRQLFTAAKVSYPPRHLLWRVFKRERVLEVWAGAKEGAELTHVARYTICAASGDLGPKKKDGDSQVPEGYYVLDHFKNSSDYYLAMRVNYPNARDRGLRYTGSAIMVHGNCVSIGCLAMGDERIQELWVMASALRVQGKAVHVHIYPARDIAGLISATKDEGLRSFWSNLQLGLTRFDKQHLLPRVTADRQGRYVFR